MSKFSATSIQQLDSSIITCCSYHRDYLKKIQKDAPYFCCIYDHVLDRAEKLIQIKGKQKQQAHIFDFGCGQGIFGIYAKMNGWGKVSLMDINEHCTHNATAFTNELNLQDVNIQTGSENEVMDFFKNQQQPDVLTSLDVIEHVYDIDLMLEILKKSLPETSLIFVTGAVAENPLRSKMMKRLQIADEYDSIDTLQTFSDNPYAGLNFREVRKRIITDADIDHKLAEKEINELVFKTRGQNKQDIIASLKNYLQNGIMPKELKHPTNTCDPISSSWTERLLTVEEYKEIFTRNGYNLKVYPGKYNDITNSGLKKMSLKMLNNFVQFFNTPQYSAYLLLEATPS